MVLERTRGVGAGLVVLALAVPAAGGTLTIPLTEFLGDYVHDAFGPSVLGSYRFLSRATMFEYGEVDRMGLIVRGTAVPAVVRGDGVVREAREVTMRNELGYGFGSIYDWWGEPVFPPPGPFEVTRYVDGDFDAHRPIPPLPDDLFHYEVGFRIALTPWPGLPPRLVPRPPSTPWWEGLVLVTPATATVTEAYLVLEGPGVPEPATLVLVGGGTALLAARRARKRQEGGAAPHGAAR